MQQTVPITISIQRTVKYQKTYHISPEELEKLKNGKNTAVFSKAVCDANAASGGDYDYEIRNEQTGEIIVPWLSAGGASHG